MAVWTEENPPIAFSREKIEMKTTTLLMIAALTFSSDAFAVDGKAYEVTITNVTAG